MKKLFLAACSITSVFFAAAQPKETLSLSKQEAETLFLQQNFDLLTARLEISQSEAQLIQAKLWPNPTFTLGDVNLWKNNTVEEQPALINEWGKTTQFSLEIEQVIQTAGKRRKNIELQQLAVEEKNYEFEAILKQLKLDLRTNLAELHYQNAIQNLYKNQIEATEKLMKAYQSQLNHGNISQADYIRLKAATMQFRKELLEVNKAYEAVSKTVKNLLGLDASVTLEITDAFTIPKVTLSEMQLNQWMQASQEKHPSILLSQNAQAQAEKKLAIEKATRIPDLAFTANYDRAGNIMQNFVGVGLSFDLPVFNRNKGAILEAKLEIDKQSKAITSKIKENANDIEEAYRLLLQSQEMYNSIEPNYEETLDQLLLSYHENFLNKNVNLITYLDFVDAYLRNKTLLLEAQKDLVEHVELLQFALGQNL